MPRLRDVTAAAKGLQVVQVERIAAASERHDVIAFEPARVSARATAIAVALEDGAAGRSPAGGVEFSVAPAHRKNLWLLLGKATKGRFTREEDGS